MHHPASPFGDFFPGPGPVPAVEAADLEAIWNLQNDMQAGHPGQSVSFDIRTHLRALRPDADAYSAWYRLSILALLLYMKKMGGLEFSWLPEGKPSNAVFKALAIVPVIGVPVGKPTNRLPFDLDEFSRLVQKETDGSQAG
jgi:hypothetical protein